MSNSGSAVPRAGFILSLFPPAALVIAGVGGLLRLAYGFGAGGDPTLYHPIIDESSYDLLARAIAAGADGWNGPFTRPPLYPYLLGGLYAVFGPSLAVARLVQALIAAGTCLLTFLLGRRVFDQRSGLIASGAVAAYGPLIFFDQRLLASSLVVFCFTLALLAGVHAVQKRTWSAWLLCGLANGLAALARPNILPFVAFLALWIVVSSIRLGRWKELLLGVTALLGATAAVVAPATIRNYRVTGEFVPIAVIGGMNLYLGNNPNAEETQAVRPGPEWERLERLPHKDGYLKLPETEAWFVDQVLDYARTQPGDFARGLARKARLFWTAIEVPRNFDPYLHAGYSAVLSVLMWRIGPFGFPFGVLAPLAAAGMAMALWDRPRAAAAPPPAPDTSPGGSGAAARVAPIICCLGYLVCLWVSVSLFFTAARYRLPVVPVLAVFAGYLVARLLWNRRGTQWRAFAAGVGAGVVALVGVNWPARTPYDGINFKADVYDCLGCQLILEGNLEKAEQAFRRAFELNPDDAELYVNLAYLAERRNRPQESLRHSRRAAELDPGMTEAKVAIGRVLAGLGRFDQAEEVLSGARRQDPTNPMAAHALGMVLAAAGKPLSAEAQLRDAIKYDRQTAQYAVDLSTLLVREGEVEAAAAVLKESLDFSRASQLLEALAWLNATGPSSVRDPEAALKLAREAAKRRGRQDASLLDTQAAALAAAGQYREAARVASEAVQAARRTGQHELAAGIDRRRTTYERGRSWDDPLRG